MLYQTPKVTIAAGGTQQSPTPGVRTAARWVLIQSIAANNAAGASVGGTGVTVPGGANPGYFLAAGTSVLLPNNAVDTPYDLQTIFINAVTTGDVFNVIYFK